jgi:competence protein ComEC
MTDALRAVLTRFRAYQLGTPGSSFSYFADKRFTLIEGRATEAKQTSLMRELEICGKSVIDALHITSWDKDHCEVDELLWILTTLKPNKIEYPGYAPHSEMGEDCLEAITRYQQKQRTIGREVKLHKIDPEYIKGLDTAKGLGYREIFYHPRELYPEQSNNNSTVKLFRSGMFNVASLGDVEHSNIGSMLRRCKIFSSEVDVLILAHHGADNGLTTKHFLETVKPTVAICSSDYDNQYEHPKQEIRDILSELGIPIYTTKTGDVVIKSLPEHRTNYRVVNLKADSTEVSSAKDYRSKKVRLLGMNADTLRNRAHPGFTGLKK